MATYQTPLERLLDGVEDIPLRNEINSIINMLEIEKLELIAELDELEREREGLLNLVSYHKEKQKDAEDKNEPYRHQNKRYREAMVYVTETHPEQYRNHENMLEDIKFVVNKTLEGESE